MNLISRLTDSGTSLVIASPTLSPAGQETVGLFKAIDQKRPGAFEKIMSHAHEVMDVGNVAQAVAHRNASLGIVYSSQVLALQRTGECVREVALPASYRANVPFTVSVLNASRFHAVDARRKRLDKELETFYLSKLGERTFEDWGFVAKR